jgi:hypothetical protein
MGAGGAHTVPVEVCANAAAGGRQGQNQRQCRQRNAHHPSPFCEQQGKRYQVATPG